MSSRANRPSPSVSATTQSVGTQMQGNDGNMWEVSETKSGIKRWVKSDANTPTKKPKVNASKIASNIIKENRAKGGIEPKVGDKFFHASTGGKLGDIFEISDIDNFEVKINDLKGNLLQTYSLDMVKSAIKAGTWVSVPATASNTLATSNSALGSTIDMPTFARNNNIKSNTRFPLEDIKFTINGQDFIITNEYYWKKHTVKFSENWVIGLQNIEIKKDQIRNLFEKFWDSSIISGSTKYPQNQDPLDFKIAGNYKFDVLFNDNLEAFNKIIFDFLVANPDIKPKVSSQTQKPIPPFAEEIINTNNIGYSDNLEQKKTELGQLLTMRKMLSPIAFERKLLINQRITDVQKQINEINFNIVERGLKKDNLIDELFEQSFAPIQQSYEEVYKSPATEGAEDVGFFFAPNGEPSKLSDALNQVIRTPDFFEWFGNWQLAYTYKDIDPDAIPCSKVVSKNFEPMVVWHGTGSEFSYFRFETFPAAYFAVTEAYSRWFAQLHGGDDGYTIPFFLNIRNPLDLTHFHTKKIPPKDFFDYLFLKTGLSIDDLEVNPIFRQSDVPPLETWQILRNNAAMLKKLSESDVFDGIHFFETNPSVPVGEAAHQTEAFIAFRADQCKIADPQRGKQLLASLKSFVLKRGGKI